MATYDYGPLKATADRLIVRYGKTATLVKKSFGGESHNPTITDTNHAIVVVQLNFNYRDMGSSVIEEGDVRLLIAVQSLSVDPSKDDEVVIDGVVWSIVNSQPLNPGGTKMLFDVQVRK